MFEQSERQPRAVFRSRSDGNFLCNASEELLPCHFFLLFFSPHAHHEIIRIYLSPAKNTPQLCCGWVIHFLCARAVRTEFSLA